MGNFVYVPSDIIVIIMEKMDLCQLVEFECVNKQIKQIIQTHQ
jgi:hypothetical protein